jgi:peptidoglycan/LPS O-acetylase OafA/YrhL
MGQLPQAETLPADQIFRTRDLSAKPSSYRQAIDLARFIAAFGIVAAHAYAMEEDWVGHIALGLFLVLTAYLAVQSALRAGGRYPFLARAQKLILPWLFWSLVFRIVLLKVNHGPDRFAILSDPWSLLVGPMVHLWFLPFVMLAMVAVEPVARHVTTPRRLGVALAGLVLISLPMFWAIRYLSLPVPLPQWLFAVPVYGLGLLMGVAHSMNRVSWPLVASVAMTAGALVFSAGAPWAYTILGAVLAFELFWRLPLQGDWLPKLGQVAFGIYLIHPFFMLVVYKFAGAEVDRFLATLVVFVMSWAATVLLRRMAFFRRVT